MIAQSYFGRMYRTVLGNHATSEKPHFKAGNVLRVKISIIRAMQRHLCGWQNTKYNPIIYHRTVQHSTAHYPRDIYIASKLHNVLEWRAGKVKRATIDNAVYTFLVQSQPTPARVPAAVIIVGLCPRLPGQERPSQDSYDTLRSAAWPRLLQKSPAGCVGVRGTALSSGLAGLHWAEQVPYCIQPLGHHKRPTIKTRHLRGR
jgi:hypothetical protein